MGWKLVKSEALKILGNGAKVPDLAPAIVKGFDSTQKTSRAFLAARDELETKLLALDNANSATLNAVEQFRGKVEKNDFDLDEKKDSKKIEDARKVLLGEIDEWMGRLKSYDKTMNELGRHLAQLDKYKHESCDP